MTSNKTVANIKTMRKTSRDKNGLSDVLLRSIPLPFGSISLIAIKNSPCIYYSSPSRQRSWQVCFSVTYHTISCWTWRKPSWYHFPQITGKALANFEVKNNARAWTLYRNLGHAPLDDMKLVGSLVIVNLSRRSSYSLWFMVSENQASVARLFIALS